MIRFFFRFAGLWLLAGAFVTLVIDGTRSIAASRLVTTPLGEAWTAIDPRGIELLRSAIERNLPFWLWENALAYILFMPLWSLFGFLGVVFVFLGRPRARSIGYSSRD